MLEELFGKENLQPKPTPRVVKNFELTAEEVEIVKNILTRRRKSREKSV